MGCVLVTNQLPLVQLYKEGSNPNTLGSSGSHSRFWQVMENHSLTFVLLSLFVCGSTALTVVSNEACSANGRSTVTPYKSKVAGLACALQAIPFLNRGEVRRAMHLAIRLQRGVRSDHVLEWNVQVRPKLLSEECNGE